MLWANWYNPRMFIDEVDITVKAGHGGPGKASFAVYGPDGGNGGKGGDVYIKVTSNLKALNQFSVDSKVVAQDGIPGSNRNSHGKKGEDTIITLPIGSSLTEVSTHEVLELDNLDQNILICKGGLGGLGNAEFKSSKNRAPKYAQPGLPGEFKSFKVILRFIADYGLIGLPNAGKSSLLNELTNSKAAVGAYPFTTLEANLGTYGQYVIADIPGLIEGASAGKGLGTKFLKHIEKVKMLLHCISCESEDVIADFETVNAELEKFNPELVTKQRIILLTKSDMVSGEKLESLQEQLLVLKYPVLPISIHDLDSLEKLTKTLKI